MTCFPLFSDVGLHGSLIAALICSFAKLVPQYYLFSIQACSLSTDVAKAQRSPANTYHLHRLVFIPYYGTTVTTNAVEDTD